MPSGYWVYAIYNQKHSKIYVGQTMDLGNKIYEHNDPLSSKHTYTQKFDGTWMCFYKEKLKSRHEALVREKELKSYRGREFLKKLIINPL